MFLSRSWSFFQDMWICCHIFWNYFYPEQVCLLQVCINIFIWPLGLYGWSFTPSPSVVEEGRLGDKPKDCPGICGRLIIVLWCLNQAFKRTQAAKLYWILNLLMLYCLQLPVKVIRLYSTSDIFHLWLKLASLILKFCRRKTSFQWYPDQSDWINWGWNMHKNAQKLEWKTQQNFPLLHLVTLL